MPARRYAVRSISSCAWGFGAVRPLLKPSLLAELPLIRQYTGRSRSSATLNGASTTDPPPSLRTIPLARASNALHRPSGETAPSCSTAVK